MSIQKILAIRLREIGDTVMMTPMLRQLKRIHPTATLDVLCESRNVEVLQDNPHIDHFHFLPRKASVGRFLALADHLRRQRYDLVVDSQSLPKTAILTRLTNAPRRLGFKNRWFRNRLCYTHPFLRDPLQYTTVSNLLLLQDPRVDLNDVRLEVPEFAPCQFAVQPVVKQAQGRPLVAINPVTRFDDRRWRYDGFADIADRLSLLGFMPLLLYGPGERKHAEEVAQRMTTHAIIDYPIPNLRELRYLLGACRLYVGNDGGTRHLAIAAGMPTVTVFGNSSDPWTPWHDPRHRVVVSSMAGPGIRACGERLDHAPWITDIPIESVWQQVQWLLKNAMLSTSKQAA